MTNRPSAGGIIEVANQRERHLHRRHGTPYRHLGIKWWWACPFCSMGSRDNTQALKDHVATHLRPASRPKGDTDGDTDSGEGAES